VPKFAKFILSAAALVLLAAIMLLNIGVRFFAGKRGLPTSQAG